MNHKSKKKTVRKVIVWSIIGVCIAALLGAFAAFRPKSGNSTEVTPKKSDITTYYSFSGSIEAKNKQAVFADKAMQIQEIKVEKGQVIKKDDVLMTTVTGEEIKANIKGEISAVLAEKNAQLMPGAKLMDIVDYENLQLSIQVDEYDLSSIAKGKDATVTIPALGKDVNGKIAEVSKEGVHVNGVTFFTAAVTLEKDPTLKVGMSAEARVLDRSVTDVVTLPMSAIQFNDDNTPYVQVKEGNATQQVNIVLGITDGINVEIQEGIDTNDIILVPKEKNTDFGPGAMGRQDMNEGTAAGGTGGNEQ